MLLFSGVDAVLTLQCSLQTSSAGLACGVVERGRTTLSRRRAAMTLTTGLTGPPVIHRVLGTARSGRPRAQSGFSTSRSPVCRLARSGARYSILTNAIASAAENRAFQPSEARGPLSRPGRRCRSVWRQHHPRSCHGIATTPIDGRRKNLYRPDRVAIDLKDLSECPGHHRDRHPFLPHLLHPSALPR